MDHTGHNHPHLDPSMFSELVDAVSSAETIENLFVLFVPDPPRFIVADVKEDGQVKVIGAIPLSYVLDISEGLIRAYQSVVRVPENFDDDGSEEERPKAGPFQVL